MLALSGEKEAITKSNQSERLERLRAIPLFAECGDDSLRRILAVATEFTAERGHVLTQPNQPGSGLFIVEDGTVTVELPDKRVELGPGEFFGELAILDDGALRSARVSASTPVRCLALRREDFENLLESEPKMALTLLRTLARRLVTSLQR